MAWFRNHYICEHCGTAWTDEWSCKCDDDCPSCGARHMSADKSDDLTNIIEECKGEFIVFWSPESAEHSPNYCELGRFPTQEKALAFLATD